MGPRAATVWSIYVLRTRQGALYTGITTDLKRRLGAHSVGHGAKALRGRGPFEVVYRKRIGGHGLALRIELRLKRCTKPEKEAIVSEQPTRAELLAGLLPGLCIIRACDRSRRFSRRSSRSRDAGGRRSVPSRRRSS
jgi:putative endonuclease